MNRWHSNRATQIVYSDTTKIRSDYKPQKTPKTMEEFAKGKRWLIATHRHKQSANINDLSTHIQGVARFRGGASGGGAGYTTDSTETGIGESGPSGGGRGSRPIKDARGKRGGKGLWEC